MNALIARSIRFIPTLPSCWYAIPLRLIVGGGFLQHGYAKLARGPENFTQILDAHRAAASLGKAEATALTDDAAVAERAGLKIVMVAGSTENRKITTADDLQQAQAMETRTALFTVHPWPIRCMAASITLSRAGWVGRPRPRFGPTGADRRAGHSFTTWSIPWRS